MELLIQISEAVFWFLVIGLPANFIRYLAKHPDEKEKLLCALARLIKHLVRRAGNTNRSVDTR